MKRFFLWMAACALAACSQAASAAVITAAEYFIDVDPGQGKGIAASAPAPGSASSLVIHVPPSAIAVLSEGVHLLACRAQDDHGNWSIAFSRTFFKEGAPTFDVTAPMAVITPVSPDPRNSSVDSVSIVFSEPVAGFTIIGLTLRRNGGPNLLTNSQHLTTTDNTTFTLSGLAALTGIEGNYTLSLSAANSGVADGAGNRLQADTAESWVTDQTPPTAAIAAVMPDPRNSAISSLTITFSEPIGGFTLASLSLTRNGGENLLTAAQTMTSINHSVFEVTGLGSLTAMDGNYALLLRAANSGVTDQAGNRLTSDAVETWTSDQTRPMVNISAIAPDPRNTAVESIGISFSEPVTGFSLASLSLTRNGGANLLTPTQSMASADSRTFTLSGLSVLTEIDGAYTLAVSASGPAIIDTAGNALQNGSVESWLMDQAPPVATISAVSPNPRNSGVTSLALSFSEPVSGFTIQDLSLTRNSGANLFTGLEALSSSDNRNFTLSGITDLTAAEGSYLIQLRAEDSGVVDVAGKRLALDAAAAWTTDRTPPTAQIIVVSPNPRPTALDSATIVFSEPVTGVDALDLALERDGGANLLPLSARIASPDNSTFTLHDLSSLTAVDGEYTLTLRAAGSGIVDAANNALNEGASVVWAKAPNLTVAAEYFIDLDPGQGAGTPIAVASPSWPLALSVDIPASAIAALSEGAHVLSCRVRDQKGVWSVAFTRTFHKENPSKEAASVVQFIEIQWFRDGAAVGEPESIPVPAPSSQVSLSLRAALPSLNEAGVYQLLATPINSLGNRGLGASRTVLLEPGAPTPILGELRHLADGSFELRIGGELGAPFVLQNSTNLTQWIDLQMAAPGSSVRIGGNDASSPKMFFRLKAP